VINEWIAHPQWNSPDAVGPMPDGVDYYDESRLNLRTTHYMITDDAEYRYEPTTGAVFEYRRNQPCGAGCACAAHAIWRPNIGGPNG
jgi:hypothetical protein